MPTAITTMITPAVTANACSNGTRCLNNVSYDDKDSSPFICRKGIFHR